MKILLIVFILLINISHADSQVNPKRIIHRIQDTTLGKSGWYYGKSTDGHFSVELPVPFNDFTLKGDGRFTYCIGSISPEGIKFSATEMPNKDKSSKVDLDGMIERLTIPIPSSLTYSNPKTMLRSPSILNRKTMKPVHLSSIFIPETGYTHS